MDNLIAALEHEGEQLLASLLTTDTEAAALLLADADPHYFSDDASRWLVGLAREFYATRQATPPEDVVLAALKEEAERGEIAQGFLEEVAVAYGLIRMRMRRPENAALRATLLADAPAWLRERALIAAVRAVAEDLRAGKGSDGILERFSRAMATGVIDKDGPAYLFKDAEGFAAEFRDIRQHGRRIGLAIPEVDAGIMGGVAEGEVGVILGGTGTGKSHGLVWIGAAALLSGKKVLHVTLEMPGRQVWARYAARLTGIDSAVIVDDPEVVLPDLTRVGTSLDEDLRILEGASYTLGLDDLAARIERMRIVEEFVPDLILIDYVDLMKPLRANDSTHEAQAQLYMAVRGRIASIAPVWSIIQTNRGGQKVTTLDLTMTGDSFGKQRHLDIVLAWEAPERDHVENLQYGRFRPLKVRGGMTGPAVSIVADFTTSKFVVGEKPEEMAEEGATPFDGYVSPLQGRTPR